MKRPPIKRTIFFFILRIFENNIRQTIFEIVYKKKQGNLPVFEFRKNKGKDIYTKRISNFLYITGEIDVVI